MQQAKSVVGRIFVGQQKLQHGKEQYNVFNRIDKVAVGWYWLMPSKEIKRGKVRAANILGYDLAVYRGQDGKIAALDAHCPHMGAHLAEGKVDGNSLRCFFHNWSFNAKGECEDIPCMPKRTPRAVRTRSWHVQEKHGMIWLWLGDGEPTESIAEPSELQGTTYCSSIGNHFIKGCHPNVVMVNAIDEQHFHTVHNLPGDVLNMEPSRLNDSQIEFRNTGIVPDTNALGRFIGRFYEKALTYNLHYWNGSTGTVTLGPDFLHMYLMFTLRQTALGHTEGYAIAFAKKPTNIFEMLLTPVVLLLTKVAGLYFAKGDTRVFDSIKFDFKTPIAADHAVLAFIQHLEKQSSFPRAFNG
ncbi:MAG TPA: aromatic ring-hydroxylating dioxygenase subunit alpha [Drouetiella sp.]